MAANFTEEQLNKLDKSFLIQLLLSQQAQTQQLAKEVQSLNEKMQLMMEQLVLGKQNRFGRSSEKMDDTNQISFMEADGKIVFFNEAEAVCNLEAAEPEDLEIKSSKPKKQTGKKDQDLSGLTVHIVSHYMSEEDLVAESEKTAGSSFQMPSANSISLFRQRLKWMNIISAYMQARMMDTW